MKTRATQLYMRCGGCHATLRVTTDAQEAMARACEFSLEHAEHYTITYDENGFSDTPMGVQHGRSRREEG